MQGRRWTHIEDNRLRNLINNGVEDDRELARLLGRTYHAVRGRRKTLGMAGDKKASRERSCLKCHQPFLSKGIHNRLCDVCNKTNSANSSRLPSACLPSFMGVL